jgi:PAS domain S-box-containing protein
MEDTDKTKEQLIQELAAARQRVADLEALEAERRQTESQRDATLEALRESEGKLRSIIEQSADGILLADEQGVVVEWNRAQEQTTSLKRTEALGRPVWDVLYQVLFPQEQQNPAIHKWYKATIVEFLRTGQATWLNRLTEGEVERSDGTRRNVQAIMFPIKTNKGFMSASFIRDITEHKRAEEEIRRLNQFLDSVIDNANIWLGVLNEKAEVVIWNKAAEEISGYSRAEVVGQGQIWQWLYPDEEYRSIVLGEAIAVIEKGGDEQDAETIVRRKDGQTRIISWNSRGLWDEKGAPMGSIALGRDVTERKRAEAEIRHQAETLTALHETALDLAAQRSLPDLLRAIVVRATALLKARSGDIYLYRLASGDLESVLSYNLEPDFKGTVLPRGEGLSVKALESGQSLIVADHREGRSEQHMGAPSTAVVTVPIRWGDQLLGVLDLVDDAPRTFSSDDVALLERFTPLAAAALENNRLLRDLQEQIDRLKVTQAQLIQAAKLAGVGELAAGVAHELNNPLTSILGFAQLLLDVTPPDASSRGDLEIIANQARRGRDIVRNLLDFARQIKPQRWPADVNQVLCQTLVLIRQYLEKSGVAIEEDYSPGVGVLTLDSGQMKQVFLNLITNAAQAMPKGGKLRLRTACVGSEVAISVSDTGQGIPPEIRERIFEPFFTTKATSEGTGLGLSVSLGIVQGHGGRITVESRVGQGSTFTVWLPKET